MEQYVVLAQKSVLFHGIWKAQSKVSDSLARTIAAGLSSTPARVCKLLLTSTGLRLLMLDGKREQTEQVSFDSLRDILPNYYYPRCLLVIYATDPNNLSVIACSSDNVKDIDAISTAYRNHKQQTQRLRIRSHPQVTHTRTDQQKPRFLSEGHQPVVKDTFVQMRLPNGVAHETLTNTAPLRGGDINGSSQKSDLSCRSFSSSTTDTTEIEDVFSESRAPHLVHEHEVLIREPMTRAGKRVAFNLGVQTLPIDEYTDTDSINSVGSIHKLKNDMNGLTDEIKAVKILLEKSSEISREQHHRHADSRRHQNTATLKGAVKAGTSSDSPRQPIDSHLFVPTDDPGDGYDLRSVGIQTEHSSKSGRRYVKNQVKTVTSNAGKEKVGAIWKRSSSAGPKSPSASGPGAEAPSPMVGSSVQSYTSSGMGQAVSYSVHASSSPSTLKKTLTTGKTTVVRPIEDVYPSRAGRRPDTRGQRVIVFTSTGQSRM